MPMSTACAGQRFEWIERYTGSLGKIICAAQRHQCQGRVCPDLQHGFGNFTQGAIATTGNQHSVARTQGLLHQPLGVTRFPGHTNRQLPTQFTLLFDSLAYLLIERLFSMQYQQRLGIAHGCSFLAIRTVS
jgi:hypothetical protein